jgi:hypothetical protein
MLSVAPLLQMNRDAGKSITSTFETILEDLNKRAQVKWYYSQRQVL